MPAQFPYIASSIVTAAVGAVASGVWAAQVPHAPAAHPVAHSIGLQSSPMARPGLLASPGNVTNTPAQTPVQPGQAYVTPGWGAAQQVGTGGVPGTPSFTQGYGTTGPFGQSGMNQPGQPPFTEGFYGNQGVDTQMNAPGVPDFYDGFGFNRGVVPPNQGAQPTTPQPNYTTQSTTSPNSGTTIFNVGSSVGFYNGFGGGQPDFGFYAGFTK